MSVPSILYHSTPCASHLLCKNNLTWHGTTLTELLLEEKPLETNLPPQKSFKYPDKIMPLSDIWQRGPLQSLLWDALMCIAWWKWWGSRAQLSFSLPWGHSSRDLHSLYWLSAERVSSWAGLTRQADCASYCSIYAFCRCKRETLLCFYQYAILVKPWCSSLLSTDKTRDRLRVAALSSGKSHGFMHIDFNSVS